MQPDTNISSLPAIKWGVENEETAKKEYCEFMRTHHKDYRFEDVGLVLYKHFPLLAASPDGLSYCSCHGAAVVEVKYPYKYRNLPIEATLQDKANFLDNNKVLKKGHKYYSQIQTQMLVCSVNQCDFITWTTQDLVISQIAKDNDFCENLVTRTEKFSKSFLIPQLLNETFQNEAIHGFTDLGDEQVFCICKRPQFGKMIACENEDCTIDWFHYECVKLKRKPKGKWFCPVCTSSEGFGKC